MIEENDIEVQKESGFESPSDNEPIYSDNESEVPEEVSEEISPEESSSDEFVEEEKKPKPKKTPSNARFNKLRRENYQLQNRLNDLSKKFESMQEMSEKASQAAMTHYDDKIQLKIEKLKKDKIRAYEEGDIQSQVEIEDQLGSAYAERQYLNTWKAQNEVPNKPSGTSGGQRVLYDEPDEHPDQQRINRANDQWINENQWFNPRSTDYDPELSSDVQSYANKLDHYYSRSGQSHKIASREYFEKINRYVQTIQEDFYEPEERIQPRTLSMKSASTPVSPVGRSTRQAVNQKPRITLSEDEKFMVKQYGITEEEYIKHKVKTPAGMEYLKSKGRG